MVKRLKHSRSDGPAGNSADRENMFGKAGLNVFQLCQESRRRAGRVNTAAFGGDDEYRVFSIDGRRMQRSRGQARLLLFCGPDGGNRLLIEPAQIRRAYILEVWSGGIGGSLVGRRILPDGCPLVEFHNV